MFSGLQRYKRSEQILFSLVLMIALLGLFGWITGRILFAQFSVFYIPIAPSTAVSFIILTLTLLFFYRFRASKATKVFSKIFVVLILVLVSLILLKWIIGFSWDAEDIFLKNPEMKDNYVSGRMSPVTASLFVLVCLASLIFFDMKGNSR